MSTRRDVVIIGAGHNALVAAFYLAKAGLKPLLLERRPVAGGAAITDEFYPGFKCSTLAHSAGPLSREVVRDMDLGRHGLEMIRPDVQLFAPSRDGRALLLYRDSWRSAQQIAKFSKSDAVKFPEFEQALGHIAGVLRRLMAEAAPAIEKPGTADLWGLLKTARGLRSLGKKDMLRLLRWGPMAVADLVGEWFETELLQASIAARGIFGTSLGPTSAGSTAVLLLRAALDANPAGGAEFPRGGMGSVARAMAAATTEAGAEIRTGAEVAGISIRDGSVMGLALSSGEEIAAKLVVSSADPRRTFLRLVDPVHLDPDFLVKMQNYRCLGTVAKVNLALAGLPPFTAIEAVAGAAQGEALAERTRAALGGRIHIGPEVDYLERAFDASKYGEFSPHPVLDVAIPSLTDPSLAPAGQQVMSINAQFAPFELKSGGWNCQRDALGDAVVKTLAEYAPSLPGLVVHRQVITPLDLEETYALTGGHIYHGELALDQLFTMRPLLGWARYRTPVQRLYLCGSGTHPGSGLTGASGRNAAREILKDWKKFKKH